MKKNFNNSKESSNNNIFSSNRYRFKKLTSQIFRRQIEVFKSIDKYFQTSKIDIDFYYKLSPRVRRRNSIETTKLYLPQKITTIKRTKTTIDFKDKLKLLYLKDFEKEYTITAERMNQNLMENPTFDIMEQRIKFLTKLNPFYEEFSQFERHSEAIISTIASEYKGKIIPENKIIFRYGDENNDFYLIHKGKVNIYCPYTLNIYMNIDEYHIYLLRLRRYNEIEMLNNVLLMNNISYIRDNEEQFHFDKYVLKLYNTYIKLKFSPGSLKQKLKMKFNKTSTNFKKNNAKYISQSEYNEVIYKSFNDNDIKNLVMRIENELIETMLYIYPHEMKQVINEESIDGELIKRIVKMPYYLVDNLKRMHPDEVKSDINNNINNDYIKRIAPIKVFNTDLQRQRVTIMGYIYIKTLSKGEYFGETLLDSNEYFSPKLSRNMKKSKFNLNIHQYQHFYNVSAIAISDNSEEINSNYVYLGHIRREFYNQYFKRFVEKTEYPKKEFLLKNRLFKNNKNENLIKTYSKCFRNRELKENECLISEKNPLTEDNTFIYFIVKGEFQSFCKQTVDSIDQVLKALNCEEQLKKTIPVKLNKIKDTFFFEEICKKELKIRLSYLSENDIIGLSENIFKDRYFNSVHCISKEGTVYYVDAKIIKLFVEGNRVIRENKNVLLYDKYKVLTDLLLKQRKSYLDSFCSFQIDSVEAKENSLNTQIIKNDNLLKSKRSFNKSLASTTKNAHLKIRNKVLNEPEIKEKKYTSLNSVCDILANIYRGISFELKRKERSLIFRKNYMLKNKKQKKSQSHNSKEFDMTIDLLQELENQKTSFVCFKKSKMTSIQTLKSQRSCSNINPRYNLIKNKKHKFNNLNIIKNFFKKDNENKKNIQENQTRTFKNTNSDIVPLNFDSLWNKINDNKKGVKTNILKANHFFDKMKKKYVRINNVRVNKLKTIQLNRKEMINQKLRNIYYSDFEKILLSEHLNNHTYRYKKF